jgi:hypothetical protein
MHTEEENVGVDFSQGADEDVVVDLSQVEDSGFAPCPKGTYLCTTESVEYKISQNSGNPMWAWVFEVIDGEFAGRKFFYHTVFKGKGLPMTKRALARLAPHLLQGPFNPADPAIYTPLIGRQVNVRVDIDNKNKEYGPRNNVKDVFAVSDDALLNA